MLFSSKKAGGGPNLLNLLNFLNAVADFFVVATLCARDGCKPLNKALPRPHVLIVYITPDLIACLETGGET